MSPHLYTCRKQERQKERKDRHIERKEEWKREAGRILFKKGSGFPIIKMYICRNTPDVPSESCAKRSELLNNPRADARLLDLKCTTK